MAFNYKDQLSGRADLSQLGNVNNLAACAQNELISNKNGKSRNNKEVLIKNNMFNSDIINNSQAKLLITQFNNQNKSGVITKSNLNKVNNYSSKASTGGKYYII